MATTITIPTPTSWKTTLLGALMSAALGMTQSTNQTVALIGKCAVIGLPAIWGLFMKDSNVTGGTVPQTTSPAAVAALAADATNAAIAPSAILAADATNAAIAPSAILNP